MLELNQSVLDYIENSNAELFALLKELAQIPAPSGNEDLRVEFVKKWFEKLWRKNAV